MKKSIWMSAIVIAALCGNAAFATVLSQDKPASTTITSKKTTPVKAATKTTKTTHSKHVKNS